MSKKGFILIEDACQSVGATYHGKHLGTFGDAGCFSFDPVKTITCGEGGAVVTNDLEIYAKVHRYADHGQDHTGPDRGLENHPILGTNYCISELNAAVGLAQLRKLDFILEKQRMHKRAIKDALSRIPGLDFRIIPDEQRDSSTFLSILLPTEQKARKVSQGLKQAGIDGSFYWHDNNWHYFRNWEHLKMLRSAARLPLTLLSNRPAYEKISLPRSEKIMSRTISLLIKVSWTKKELLSCIEKMISVLKE